MAKNKTKNNSIIIYEASKGDVRIDVRLENETIWLTLNQIADLFGIDKSGISRHIKNIYEEGELKEKSTVAKIATVQKEGGRNIEREIEFYNLDMIISIGYRVSSKRATDFRIWATKTLKDYLVKGYAINEKRLLEAQEKFKELQTAISFLQDKSQKSMLRDRSQEILNLLSSYAKTLTLLSEYDNGKIEEIKGGKTKFILDYKKSLKIIGKIKTELINKKEAGDLFGQERQGALETVVKNLYQTFDNKELYPTIENKASHLLYLIIKDHSFSDGNKRIGSFLFVYFLDRNGYLYKKSGEKKINDNALTALALLVAESKPEEKDVMVKIIMNLIAE
ncbi:virulence protein RhuM/Fic/DOC family protein [Patescibacteria group bacterium]|nr:virulence protein RhuM/Fic/DOC family protein [Patescibacteria group bacterium]MBU4142111.1 virulence protein RhuM/Fic/DOC family protein [Patescibacteria group bacterium]